MKKVVLAAAVATLLAAPALAETIRVGVTVGPHAQIMEKVVPEAKKLGLDIKIIEFSDYVIPNQALAQKDIDLNSFQHQPYLDNQIAKTNWKLVTVGHTILTPMGFYSSKHKNFVDIPVGGTIAIQNDPTNSARSLKLLAANGLIKMRDGASATAGILDIAENPKKIKFVELDAAQLPRALPDVDAAAINNNYAVQAGLNPSRDAILKEKNEGPYVNVLVVRDEDKGKPWVKTFVKAYQTESVKAFINEQSKGAYVAAW